ncbi:MAG: glycosyl hydrolase [Candidatus Poribacteria bacterium]|nr:glycosyl hydrolase [Candidatus Poribacteria bacterium]
MNWTGSVLLVPFAIGAVGMSAAFAQTTAIPANDFLNSIGVNTAVSRRGESLEKTIECATYLGIRFVRVGYESRIPVEDLIELHKQTGVRSSYGLMSGGTNLERLLDGARRLAEVGALVALEGNNEPNNWGVTYQDEKGGRELTWLPVAKLQRDLYAAVKSDPVLRDYPVWNLTEGGAQTDNVGLQFLTIPDGAETLMPPGTRYADYANCHNYVTHPSWRGLHDNQTWIAADPSPECKVDGLYGNYGKTWRKKFDGYSLEELTTLPRVTTETGVKIEGDVTEEIQALWFLSLYLDQLKRGWSHTAMYILRDRSDEGGNQSYGFYAPDYTPRLAATYLHNLTTILADDASIDTPGSLNYSIPNQPDTVHDMLLQKRDGTFALIVWNERIEGSDEVRVALGETVASVAIYDPTVGTESVESVANADSVKVTLSDHPVVLEFSVQ